MLSRFFIDFLFINLILAISESARGIVIPTLSSCVSSINASKFFLNVCIAAFSGGRLLSSYLNGVMLDGGYSPTRLLTPTVFSLLLSLSLTLIGSIVYIYSSSIWMLIISRFLSGYGTGVLSNCRIFVSERTSSQSRTKYMSVLGITQFLGFALTPLVGAFSLHKNIYLVNLTSHTTGTFFLICTIIPLLVTVAVFMDRPTIQSSNLASPLMDNQAPASDADADQPSTNTTKTEAIESSEAASEYVTIAVVPSESNRVDSPSDPDASSGALRSLFRRFWLSQCSIMFLVWFLISINFVSRGTLSVMEALGSVFYFDTVYGKSQSSNPSESMITSFSFYMFYIGLGGFLVYLCCHRLSRVIGDYGLIIAGLACGFVGFCLLVDFDDDETFSQMTFGMVLLWALSGPLLQTVVSSQLSKVISANSLPSGKWMGILTAAGSVGRISYPLAAGVAIDTIHHGGVFYSCGFSLSILLIIAMLPHARNGLIHLISNPCVEEPKSVSNPIPSSVTAVQSPTTKYESLNAMSSYDDCGLVSCDSTLVDIHNVDSHSYIALSQSYQSNNYKNTINS